MVMEGVGLNVIYVTFSLPLFLSLSLPPSFFLSPSILFLSFSKSMCDE